MRTPASYNTPDYLDVPEKPSKSSQESRAKDPAPEEDGETYFPGLMAGGVVLWGLLVAGGAGIWLWMADAETQMEAGFGLAATIAVGASLMGLLCFIAAMWLFAGQRLTKTRLAALERDFKEASSGLAATEEALSMEKRDHEMTLRAARRLAMRHDALFHVAPYPVLVVEPAARRVLFANRRAGGLFGLTPTELSKRRFSVFVPQPADYERLMALVADGGDAETGTEISMCDAAGRSFRVHVYAVNIDYDGQQAIYLMMEDLAEKQRLEQALERSTGQVHAQQAELAHLREEVGSQKDIIDSLGKQVRVQSSPK